MTTSFPSRIFMFPRQGAWPSFDDVLFIVLVGAGLDLSVCVICFSGYMMRKWQERLAALPAETVTLLDVTGWSPAELRHYLAQRQNDMTILSGVRSALMGTRTTVSLIRSFAAAVPSGTVIAA